MISKPSEIVIEITARCNLDCQNCFNKASFAKNSRNHKEMSTEMIKSIIDNIKNYGIKKVRFSGGEPFLRKDIVELIKYANDKGLIVWLNTNTTLITKDIVKKIENYVEDVLVPLNGFDKESEKEWTNCNEFNDKINGLKILKNSKIPYVRAGTVATPNNIINLEKIYEIVKENDLDSWEIYRPIPLKQSKDKFDIDNVLKKLEKLSDDFGKLIPIANAIPLCATDPKKMDRFCVGSQFDDGYSRFVIDPKGFAKPSYFIDKNLGDPKDIDGCWNSDFMKKIRNLKFLPRRCEGCRFMMKCRGGSRYIANLNEGNYSAEDPLMDISNLR